MKIKLKVLIFVLLCFWTISVKYACADEIYVIHLFYDRGNLILDPSIFNNTYVKEGFAQKRQIFKGNFKYELVSFSNKNLFMKEFSIPLERVEDNIEIIEKTPYILQTPYYYNTKTINIYNITNNKTLLSIDVSEFAKCNENRICESFENNQTCPQDCIQGLKLVEKNISIKNLITNPKITIPFIILIIVVIIVAKKYLQSRTKIELQSEKVGTPAI